MPGHVLNTIRVDAQFNQEASVMEVFNQELFNIFPSLFIRYQASEESPHQYQISYGRRIERPSFNQVNPIRSTTTPQLLFTGNLELLPQFRQHHRGQSFVSVQ